jgi:hypothetical protein
MTWREGGATEHATLRTGTGSLEMVGKAETAMKTEETIEVIEVPTHASLTEFLIPANDRNGMIHDAEIPQI